MSVVIASALISDLNHKLLRFEIFDLTIFEEEMFEHKEKR